MTKSSSDMDSPTPDRRDILRSIALGGLGVAGAASAADAATVARRLPAGAPSAAGSGAGAGPWRAGVEGQRRADLGNGRFLNPVLAGDHPDPTILKDGDDYYASFSSFDYYPGIVIWHSRDLVNWTPIGPALTKWIGTVYALDLVKHDGRFYIYIPVIGFEFRGDGQMAMRPGVPPLATYVIHADSMNGPWSDPIDLKIAAIDPGHAVGEDGKRYLFVNDGRRILLTGDGLATVGKLEKVYKGWRYPAEWVVEGYSLEGPKMLRKDGWFYMFSAVGGTAGPPTGHMVIVARSRSIHGPWEDCPHNPIVRTQSARERWWSRGHATAVEGPRGDWWMIYHGYENGYRTLGRQLLLEPIVWTADGWPRATGGDLTRTLPMPSGRAGGVAAGLALSDDFSRDMLGTRLAILAAGAGYHDGIQVSGNSLTVRGRGKTPTGSALLGFVPGDHSYEVRVEVELSGTAEAGLLLYYGPRFYAGLGFDAKRSHFYQHGNPAFGAPTPTPAGRLHLRVINDENVASFYFGTDGKTWTLHSSVEVSGYNHNVANGFLSLRPSIYVTGDGAATFRNLRYVARG